MKFGFGSRELLLLQLLYSPNSTVATYSVSDAAREMGISVPVVSRVASSLAEKGFLEVKRKGKRKVISFSNTPHATALLQLAAENQHVALEKALSDASIRVLSGMLYPPSSVEAISRITRTPEITVRRTLAKLLEKGVIARPKLTEYRIILPRLHDFIEEYSKSFLRSRIAGLKGVFNPWWPNAVFRTAEQSTEFMTPTGISVFHKYGIKLIQMDSRDYYFNAFDDKAKQPTLEEAVIHALTWTVKNSSARETSYAMLVIHKNWKKFDKEKFDEIAKEWGVQSIAERCVKLVDGFVRNEKWKEPTFKELPRAEGPVFPSWEEFEELVKQYE